MTNRVYLSLGSNLGDRKANLHAAVETLRSHLTIGAVSSLYETEPVGVTDQPSFLNLALAAQTELAPLDLLRTVKAVEAEIGRRPTFHWGPRVIDIDILLYGDQTVDEELLHIPHRELANRAFVLLPLAEIAADVEHPTLHCTISELAEQVGGRDGVRLLHAY